MKISAKDEGHSLHVKLCGDEAVTKSTRMMNFPREKTISGELEGHGKRKYQGGKIGDNMLTHFQCDKCQFGKINGRYPDSLAEKDMRSMVLVRRATLDVF